MEVNVTTFTNPFSFFCTVETATDEREIPNCLPNIMCGASARVNADFSHAEYVAVMCNGKWVRGIISKENQLLIWLVDQGIYLRPNEKTVVVQLPAQFKTYPSMVFEASIHGVTPIDKVVSDDCQIESVPSTSWNNGAIEKAKKLIQNAVKKYFMPIAILSTKNNDIVLGDLYLQMKDKRTVNIVDNLELWPIFLEKNRETYLKDFPLYYTSHRKHGAVNQSKPIFPDIQVPTIHLEVSFAEYNTLCEQPSLLEHILEYESDSEDGSTVTYLYFNDISCVRKPTPTRTKQTSYLNQSTVSGNTSKIDESGDFDSVLKLCKKYENYDLKRVGRASYHRRSFI